MKDQKDKFLEAAKLIGQGEVTVAAACKQVGITTPAYYYYLKRATKSQPGEQTEEPKARKYRKKSSPEMLTIPMPQEDKMIILIGSPRDINAALSRVK